MAADDKHCTNDKRCTKIQRQHINKLNGKVVSKIRVDGKRQRSQW